MNFIAAAPPRQKSLCALLSDLADPSERDTAKFCHIRRLPARSTIRHPMEDSDAIIAIAKGWASTSISMADGRRQILSFVLTGEIVPTGYLFAPMPDYVTIAITDVTYREFDRNEVLKRLENRPDIFQKFLRHWVDERDKSDHLAFDLGRGTVTERIIRLLWDLTSRLSVQEPRPPKTVGFPLRQKHIADATGTTSINVGKVFSQLRRSGLIAMDDRSLTILKETDLRHIVSR